LNLAALVPTLPSVIIPNGKELQLRPLTAEGYELYRQMRQLTAQVQNGGEVDEDAYVNVIDRLLGVVLPDATDDDLASFGVRYELKMAPILAAAGRVDEVVSALASAAPEGNEVAQPDSLPDTISAAPLRSTRKRSGKIGRPSGGG
jgi:hypothetical protein